MTNSKIILLIMCMLYWYVILFAITFYTAYSNPSKTVTVYINTVGEAYIDKKDPLIETLGCCCGHGRYPMTIVVKNKHGLIYELMSSKVIPRTRRFYVRDEKGHYYIPEVSNK